MASLDMDVLKWMAAMPLTTPLPTPGMSVRRAGALPRAGWGPSAKAHTVGTTWVLTLTLQGHQQPPNCPVRPLGLQPRPELDHSQLWLSGTCSLMGQALWECEQCWAEG